VISKRWLGSWVEEAAEEATETKRGAQQRTSEQRKVHGQRGTWA